MGAVTDYYVDPALGSDTGDGSIETPWGRAAGSVVQYALDNITQDATNGDRINIKSGTDDTLGAGLDLTTYGVPTAAAPMMFQGYAAVTGDGNLLTGVGIGGIDGAATFSVITSTTLDYIHFRHLHVHNCGAAPIIKLRTGCTVIECEIDNTTGNGVQITGTGWLVFGNHIHNIGTIGLYTNGNGWHRYYHNYFANGTNDFTQAISGSAFDMIGFNIFSLDGTTDAMNLGSNATIFYHNSILSAAGTGKGIEWTGVGRNLCFALSNLVEGFSGAGGVGLDYNNQEDGLVTAGNAVYDCETAYDNENGEELPNDDNEELSVSPFAKSGGDTFANRFVYFGSVDTGNVHGGAYRGK